MRKIESLNSYLAAASLAGVSAAAGTALAVTLVLGLWPSLVGLAGRIF